MSAAQVFKPAVAFLLLAAGSCFAQSTHGIKVTWNQATCTNGPCTITANSVYKGSTSAGPFTKLFDSTAPITSYLDPMTPTNQGTQACYTVTAYVSTIESPQSSAVCQTFPVQSGSPTSVQAVQQ